MVSWSGMSPGAESLTNQVTKYFNFFCIIEFKPFFISKDRYLHI